MPPRLSVIVPATNLPPTLSHCLAAIERAACASDEVVLVTEPPYGGPAAARNRGARQAEGDVLVFVDADVRIAPDALDRIRSVFARRPELTALFGSYDDAPAAPGVVSRFRNLLHHHNHQTAETRATTFWAGLGAVRREAFLASGGFDAARYHAPSIEDVELGLRLSDAGARIEIHRDVQGTHLKHWNLATMVRTDLLRRGVPWVAMLVRRGSSSSSMNTGARHRLSALAALVATAGVPARRPLVATGGLLALLGLNRDLYALLRRRLGLRGAACGLGLHVVHQLVAVASVPLGALSVLTERAAGRVGAGTGPLRDGPDEHDDEEPSSSAAPDPRVLALAGTLSG